MKTFYCPIIKQESIIDIYNNIDKLEKLNLYYISNRAKLNLYTQLLNERIKLNNKFNNHKSIQNQYHIKKRVIKRLKKSNVVEIHNLEMEIDTIKNLIKYK